MVLSRVISRAAMVLTLVREDLSDAQVKTNPRAPQSKQDATSLGEEDRGRCSASVGELTLNPVSNSGLRTILPASCVVQDRPQKLCKNLNPKP